MCCKKDKTRSFLQHKFTGDCGFWPLQNHTENRVARIFVFTGTGCFGNIFSEIAVLTIKKVKKRHALFFIHHA